MVVVAVVDELRFKLEEAWGASPADWAISDGESRFTSVYFGSVQSHSALELLLA